MQASGLHADVFRRPVQRPGQHEGKDHLHGATELALTEQLYGRWTPTPCTPDSLKLTLHAAARLEHRSATSESLGNHTFHGPNTFSQHRLEELELFIEPRLLAMAEEAEQQQHRQAEEQAQLEAMRQQRRRQELTETARPLQQPQQQAVGQPRGAEDRFLDVLRGAEAAHPANTRIDKPACINNLKKLLMLPATLRGNSPGLFELDCPLRQLLTDTNCSPLVTTHWPAPRQTPKRAVKVAAIQTAGQDRKQSGLQRLASTSCERLRQASDSVVKFAAALAKSKKEWNLERYIQRAKRIDALEEAMKSLTDQELAIKTAEFRARLKHGATKDDILEEAFAVVREASSRVMSLRHYQVQLVGGMALVNGYIAEMATGEGKTLVATLAAYLHALEGRGVHVVTVNEYLANRDANWVGKIFTFLGMTVGFATSSSGYAARRQAFMCDVTYTTATAMCWSYLFSNLAMAPEEQYLPRPLAFAIIDEVDHILIDECRNPFYIANSGSGKISPYAEQYKVSNEVAEDLVRQHRAHADPSNPADSDFLQADQSMKTVTIKDKGLLAAARFLQGRGLLEVEQGIWSQNDPRLGGTLAWGSFLLTALKAQICYMRNRDYICKGGEIIIISDATGRLQEKSRWTAEIHQAIEAKEGLDVRAETSQRCCITYQSLFPMYEQLAGMSGTAAPQATELQEALVEPSHKYSCAGPMGSDDQGRQVQSGYFYWRSSGLTGQHQWRCMLEHTKYGQLVSEIHISYSRGQPVLVGTSSVEESSEIYQLLLECHTGPWSSRPVFDRAHLRILNATPELAAREAAIIAEAGTPFAITIATNMAGRGTDIILGGDAKQSVEAEFLAEWLPILSPRTGAHKEAAPKASALHPYAGHSHRPWSDPTESLRQRLLKYIAPCEAGHLLQLLRQTTVSEEAAAARQHLAQDHSLQVDDVREFISTAIERAEVLRSRCLQELREARGASRVAYNTKLAAWQELLLQKAGSWRQEYLIAQEADSANKTIKDANLGRLRALTAFQHLLAESAVPLWFWQEVRCGSLAQQVKAGKPVGVGSRAVAQGLKVICTSLQQSRRLDLQLRGRAGRQGDPGETYMLLDLDDPNMETFGSPFKNLFGGKPPGSFMDFDLRGFAIEGAIASAQRSIEALYSSSRQNVRMRSQHENWFRSNFLVQRETILKASPREQLGIVHSYLQDLADALVLSWADQSSHPCHWNYTDLAKDVRTAILPGHRETKSLETNVSFSSGPGNTVRIDLDLAALTPAALRASAEGMCTLHECLQQQPWRLQFKSAFVEHQRAVPAGTRPRRIFQGRHSQAATQLGAAIGDLFVVALEQKWQTHRLLFSRFGGGMMAPQEADHGIWEIIRGELLRRMDDLWEDFFGEISQLWEELGARVYTRLDSEQEFQIEAGELFTKLQEGMRVDAALMLLSGACFPDRASGTRQKVPVWAVQNELQTSHVALDQFKTPSDNCPSIGQSRQVLRCPARTWRGHSQPAFCKPFLSSHLRDCRTHCKQSPQQASDAAGPSNAVIVMSTKTSGDVQAASSDASQEIAAGLCHASVDIRAAETQLDFWKASDLCTASLFPRAGKLLGSLLRVNKHVNMQW
ncbi:hypothetical protein WJX74_004386 [Apatococcus lobatus]|uniref:chloroplast protein-transporting ATPase n=1 Tax=Apatococcus lobatus TaxID=904363 RepID=A0AAW1S5N0_9CHLO